ncbi:MAG: Yip1 family protein [Phycisphaerales bacterium]
MEGFPHESTPPPPPPPVQAGWDAVGVEHHPVPAPAMHTLDSGGSPWLAPAYLFVRPGFFFQRFGMTCPGLVVVLAIIFAAIMRTAGRLDANAAFGREFPVESWDEDWSVYWGVVIGASVCAGVGLVAIMGGWYWLRLLMCGVVRPRFGAALRLMGLSSVVETVPALCIAATQVAMFDSPRACAEDDSWVGIAVAVVMLLFVFWSTWTSYRGVTSVFRPKRVPTLIWYLILPWVTKGLGLAAIIVGVWLMGLSQAPDVANAQRYRGDLYRFEYPGNWQIDAEQVAFDDGALVTVKPLFQDGLVKVQVYEPSMDLEGELGEAIKVYESSGFKLTPREPIESLGPWKGTGRFYDVDYKGYAYTMRVLVTPVTEWYNADIMVMSPAGEETKLAPGYDQVLGSLKITTPDRKPTTLDDAYKVRTGDVTLRVPGNWTWNEQTSGGSRPENVTRTLEIYPHAEGIVRIIQYPTDSSPADEIEVTVDNYVDDGTQRSREDITSWGPLTGAGAVVTYETTAGQKRGVRAIVVDRGGGRMLEVQAVWADGTRALLDPGFDLVIESLTLD